MESTGMAISAVISAKPSNVNGFEDVLTLENQMIKLSDNAIVDIHPISVIRYRSQTIEEILNEKKNEECGNTVFSI